MKTALLNIIISCFTFSVLCAQIHESQVEKFMKGKTLLSISGPGLDNQSGDLLVTSKLGESGSNLLTILHSENGKLSEIGENSTLSKSIELIDWGGTTFWQLENDKLFANYEFGDDSVYGKVSIVFKKEGGKYYFDTYTLRIWNYNVEDYFARTSISKNENGKLLFEDTDESHFIKRERKEENYKYPYYSEITKTEVKIQKFIPSGYSLITFGKGDLNKDNQKDDLVLWLKGPGDHFRIQLLLQNKDGSYTSSAFNQVLFPYNENYYNKENQRIAVKDGFFTLEQRVGNGEDFDHRYLTFKYDAAANKWFLHRYDCEHYTGMNPQPDKNVTHLTAKEFGQQNFETLNFVPGDFYYEPDTAVISGKLIVRTVYGPPNWGEDPKNDEKYEILLLIPNYPVNALSPALRYGENYEPEGGLVTIRNLKELQVIQLDGDSNLNLDPYVNKEITLEGELVKGESAWHRTPVMLNVKKILK